MPHYRRSFLAGGTFFFTVVTHQRRPIFCEDWTYQALQQAFQHAMQTVGPFDIVAFCLLPDHLHCIWTLPGDDSDYSTRWKVIKASFSRQYLCQGGRPGELSVSKQQKGEKGIWQRRFWEHLIRDQADLERHIDYIHYNPVKHGVVQSIRDWAWSTVHRYVQDGHYPLDWGKDVSSLDELVIGE